MRAQAGGVSHGSAFGRCLFPPISTSVNPYGVTVFPGVHSASNRSIHPPRSDRDRGPCRLGRAAAAIQPSVSQDRSVFQQAPVGASLMAWHTVNRWPLSRTRAALRHAPRARSRVAREARVAACEAPRRSQPTRRRLARGSARGRKSGRAPSRRRSGAKRCLPSVFLCRRHLASLSRQQIPPDDTCVRA